MEEQTSTLVATSDVYTIHDYKYLPDLKLELPRASQFSLGVTRAKLFDFGPFKDWLNTLNNEFGKHKDDKDESYQLKRITVQCVDQNKTGGIGFVKLLAPVLNMNGGKVGKPYVFLRGGSVAMLVILRPKDDPENEHVLLTIQPRIAAGSLAMLELPAGKIEGAETAKAAAVQEMKEELNIDASSGGVIDLTSLALGREEKDEEYVTHKGAFSSCGGQDEFIRYYLYVHEVDHFEEKDWNNQETGLREQGERINLKTVKLSVLWKEAACDMKALSAWALYQGLRKEGKI